MRLSFVGMSNIGKTFWSKRLASASKTARIDCDRFIEAKLGDELSKLGYRGIHDVAKWMGQPSDPHYAETSAKYIANERASMREILDNPDNATAPLIIDTTGSVIYTGVDILAQLRSKTTVVYLEASDKHIENLFRQYIAHPKPVIWGDTFAPLPEETARESLARCFPDLLHERVARYRALAHVTVPFEKHGDHKADVMALFKEFIG